MVAGDAAVDAVIIRATHPVLQLLGLHLSEHHSHREYLRRVTADIRPWAIRSPSVFAQHFFTLLFRVGHHCRDADVVELVLLRAVDGIQLTTLSSACATRTAAAIIWILRRESAIIRNVEYRLYETLCHRLLALVYVVTIDACKVAERSFDGHVRHCASLELIAMIAIHERQLTEAVEHLLHGNWSPKHIHVGTTYRRSGIHQSVALPCWIVLPLFQRCLSHHVPLGHHRIVHQLIHMVIVCLLIELISWLAVFLWRCKFADGCTFYARPWRIQDELACVHEIANVQGAIPPAAFIVVERFVSVTEIIPTLRINRLTAYLLTQSVDVGKVIARAVYHVAGTSHHSAVHRVGMNVETVKRYIESVAKDECLVE